MTPYEQNLTNLVGAMDAIALRPLPPVIQAAQRVLSTIPLVLDNATDNDTDLYEGNFVDNLVENVNSVMAAHGFTADEVEHAELVRECGMKVTR